MDSMSIQEEILQNDPKAARYQALLYGYPIMRVIAYSEEDARETVAQQRYRGVDSVMLDTWAKEGSKIRRCQ